MTRKLMTALAAATGTLLLSTSGVVRRLSVGKGCLGVLRG